MTLARRRFLATTAAAASLPTVPRFARAQTAQDELRIAAATEWLALDPHFHVFPANLSIAHHMFDALTVTDRAGRARPRLAASWTPIGTEGWRFELDPRARFADGAPVTSADVAASIARIPKVPNTTGPLTPMVRPIAAVETPDARTVILRTAAAAPLLPIYLSAVYVIPARLADETTERFNTGEALVGSGPFRFAGWARGDRLTLERRDDHWAGPSEWRRVVYRVMTNPASREAALLARDVDFIQTPSTASMARLRREQGLAVFQAPSTRLTYVQFHQGAEALADTTAAGGRNPFADSRVRRAFSMCIPRQAIAERVMEGLSEPAGQIVAPGQFGFRRDLGIEAFDTARAQALLAEAGYPNGFETTLSTPNDRNVNGVQIAQAIAQSALRANIKVNVNAVPLNVWLPQWRAGRYSILLHGFGPPVESLQPVAALAHTKNMNAGLGVSNEAGYSNPTLDRIIAAALSEIDDAKRESLMLEAAGIVRETTAVVPLHHETIVYAGRSTLAHDARGDERLYAVEIQRRRA